MRIYRKLIILSILTISLFTVASCGKNDSKNVKNGKKDTQVSNEKDTGGSHEHIY